MHWQQPLQRCLQQIAGSWRQLLAPLMQHQSGQQQQQ
jgi:hypothetical protein